MSGDLAVQAPDRECGVCGHLARADHRKPSECPCCALGSGTGPRFLLLDRVLPPEMLRPLPIDTTALPPIRGEPTEALRWRRTRDK